MKPVSFRLRLALFSGVITGCLLLLSSLLLWRVTRNFTLGQLDRELRSLGQANLERVVGGDHWTRLDDALQFVAGGRSTPGGFVLWVKNYDKVVYQSAAFPRSLNPAALPLPEQYEGGYVPRPDAPAPPPPRRGEEISPRNPALPLRTPHFFTHRDQDRDWRIGVMGNPYATLVLGADLRDLNQRMSELARTYTALVVCTFLLVAAAAWITARRATQPVEALAQAAERITARGLDHRLPSMPADREFNRLVTVFNDMLRRLETSFQQATRFSADASHELKTPLARLQIELEQALEQTPPGSPQQAIYSDLLDDISRLKAILQKLLLLSLADAGRLELRREPVDLSGLVENIVEDCRLQAPQLTIESAVAPRVRVLADPQLLEQAIQNLASNALKHNQPDGFVRIHLDPDEGRARIRIANAGPGIPAADQPRIFERFYRGTHARDARVEGTGLGLSLSREILRAHEGDLSLEYSEAGRTCFQAVLPLAGAPEAGSAG